MERNRCRKPNSLLQKIIQNFPIRHHEIQNPSHLSRFRTTHPRPLLCISIPQTHLHKPTSNRNNFRRIPISLLPSNRRPSSQTTQTNTLLITITTYQQPKHINLKLTNQNRRHITNLGTKTSNQQSINFLIHGII